MKILSITAQKPDSTGSGVFLTELVKGFRELGCSQAVVCGTTAEDSLIFPKGGGVSCLLSQQRTALSCLRHVG